MKKTWKVVISLLVLLLFITINTANAAYFNYYNPRGSVWGLAGTENQGRLDVLLPVSSNSDNLFYTDLQGGYAQDDASYGSVGAGLRKLINDSAIYGGYLFVDRDESNLHNEFTVLSPGAEALFTSWDFRLNGYFPLNQRKKIMEFFPSQQTAGCGDCGMNCSDSQFIVFSGHQQFEHRFAELEEAGPGTDGEVGYTFHHLNNTQFHAGIYYFNYNGANSNTHIFNGVSTAKNITGIEGRLEMPVNPHWAVTVESSYDNYQHFAVVGGLRLNLFGIAPAKPYSDLHDQMVAPITRNIGSLATGSGIPTIKKEKDEGLFLERDNIYFFTSQGGSVFVNNAVSGTFENPLRNDQFSQPVINQIGPNANLYFNSGTYVIMGAGTPPNAQINIPFGDSIYGRSLDFKSSAIGNARPTLLGSMNLFQGNNTLDSIQLINSATSSGITNLNLLALNIQNAPNVFLCNDNINATATVNGDLQTGISNLATGINANNSQVTIQNSTISADAVVTGIIAQTGGVAGGLNFAAGIGGNSTLAASANFIGNSFTILNSTINGSVSAGEDDWKSLATGIGSNAANGGSTNFSGNSFIINNSTISSNAATNILGITTGNNTAIGIGNTNHSGTTDFANNTFSIQNSQVSDTASVSGVDGGVNNAVGIGMDGSTDFIGNHFNLTNTILSSTATVANNNFIGINQTLGIGITEFGNNFSNNIFNLTDSKINATASVSGDDSGFSNQAMGIGNNSSVAFNNNTFNLVGSTISVNALVGGDNTSSFNGNTAIGMGGFSDISSSNNTFNLTNSSVSAISSVAGNNSSANLAIGAGDLLGSNFRGNTFNLTNTTVNADALVGSNNTVLNIAVGMGDNPFTFGFTNNTFNLTNSTINTTASVNGNNLGSNQALGVNLIHGGNTATINQSIINTLANVGGTNSGSNGARGLAATGVGDSINIANSIVNTTASTSNSAIGFTGTVNSINTQYNTSP